MLIIRAVRFNRPCAEERGDQFARDESVSGGNHVIAAIKESMTEKPDKAAGKVPIRLGESAINFLSPSAQKFEGPKGVGALYISVSKRSRFRPPSSVAARKTGAPMAHTFCAQCTRKGRRGAVCGFRLAVLIRIAMFNKRSKSYCR